MKRETVVRTRYAPSPTGSMHIGNLRSALYEFLIAKSQNGKFILRIEDTDQKRQVEGALQKIYDTLQLAGLQHDEGPDVGGDYGPYVQSQRKELYKPYAIKLIESKHAYYCFCDKQRLERLKNESENKLSAKYDKHCLSLDPKEVESRLAANDEYVIRQNMPTEGSVGYEDTVYGTITVPCSELEDQILIKSDGFPTYNFANVIDDHLMKITHVVRGSEYVSSTPKYILLYKAFGWEAPQFVHLPLITKQGGKKMSKREGDASFDDLVHAGYLPQAIVNYVALLGWSPKDNREIFSLEELIEHFDMNRISRSASVFDMEKLKWFNREYLKGLSLQDFQAFMKPIYQQMGFDQTELDTDKISALIKTRLETITQAKDTIDFFVEFDENYDMDIYRHKRMKTDCENSIEYLEASMHALEAVSDWNLGAIEQALSDTVEKMGVKTGQILWPVRTALSGKPSTPGGAYEIAEILGKEESLRRIRIGLQRLKAHMNTRTGESR